ncbi:hypothetical protein BH11BAC1_BH11BAC1_15650 [soil metagenome]
MSWVRIWIHAVFATKYRTPYLNNLDVRKQFFGHIKENAKEKGLLLDSVNGYTDHAHCLFLLNRELTVSKTMQLIKGESSHWINKNEIIKEHFAWQDDYWAVGISDSGVHHVRRYIERQERHHGKKTFDEELDEFIREGGWEKGDG